MEGRRAGVGSVVCWHGGVDRLFPQFWHLLLSLLGLLHFTHILEQTVDRRGCRHKTLIREVIKGFVLVTTTIWKLQADDLITDFLLYSTEDASLYEWELMKLFQLRNYELNGIRRKKVDKT